MSDVDHRQRLLLPGLRGFYDAMAPISWLLIRVVIGGILIQHAWVKVSLGFAVMAPVFAKMGFEPGMLWTWAAFIIEFVGGICIILGLFTRFWAAAVTIEMAIIVVAYLPNGFSWLGRGWEFAFMWGVVSLAIALRGGGPYSIDRKLGWEL